jgi:uncharacterized protein YuzE
MNDPEVIKYTLQAEVTGEKGDSYGVGYIYLQKGIKLDDKTPSKTIIVQDQRGEEMGIHIDLDVDGRIFGIEVMSLSLLPPQP